MSRAWQKKSTAGTENSEVLVKELKTGRKQAFSKVYILRTNLDQSISNESYTYINNNADSICGIIYIPTAAAIYLSEYSLQQRHPSLFKQFSLLQKSGLMLSTSHHICERHLRKRMETIKFGGQMIPIGIPRALK